MTSHVTYDWIFIHSQDSESSRAESSHSLLGQTLSPRTLALRRVRARVQATQAKQRDHSGSRASSSDEQGAHAGNFESAAGRVHLLGTRAGTLRPISLHPQS